MQRLLFLEDQVHHISGL